MHSRHSSLYWAAKYDLKAFGGFGGQVPILPLLLLGLAVLPFIAGCDRVKEIVEPARCADADKPDEYEHIDERSYRVFLSIFPEEFEKGRPSPWLSRWLGGAEPNVVAMRKNLGAAEAFFRTECEGKVTSERDRKDFERYRRYSIAFFSWYFSEAYDPKDHGVLVLLGGLAPLDAGDSAVISGINSLVVPTERKSAVREQRSELGQVFKAAYSYNAAAIKADPDGRFRLEHSRLRLKPADAKYVRSRLSAMNSVLSDVKVKVLTERQRVFYDTLKQAGKNLRKAIR